MESVAEGVPTTQSLYELSRRHGVQMPITQAVCAVLLHGRTPRDAVSALLGRDAKAESMDQRHTTPGP